MSFGFILLSLALSAHATTATPVQPLTYDEAYRTVQAEEEAKELKKDAEYAAVLKDPKNVCIHSSRNANGKEVIRIGRPPMENLEDLPQPKPKAQPLDPETLAQLRDQAGKPMIHVSLSGEVDASGISEVWWKDPQGVDHRIFTNANFLYFTGFASFQNETHRYQTFLMVTQRSPQADTGDDWRPKPKDFSGGIEYFAVEPKDPESADYSTLEAMLAHYAEHEADMKTTYENRRLRARARKDYLAAHPPKERPFLMYFPAKTNKE
ncbi:MAG: hypothetical protein ACON39_01745 [Coraliomargaritaceae bacterium]